MSETSIDEIRKGFKKHMQESGNNETFSFNPDNHDQINMAIALLETESREKLAKSNDKNAKALNYLTLALVLIGLVQLIIQFCK